LAVFIAGGVTLRFVGRDTAEAKPSGAEVPGSEIERPLITVE
jgi:hypothetical protein